VNKLVIAAIASSLLLFTGTIARAQTARARIADTPIRGDANLASAIIATLKEGDRVDVVNRQGEWYRVLVPNEQGPARAGYVLAHLLEILNADGSSESIPAPTSRAARPIAEGPPIAPTLAQLRPKRDKAAERVAERVQAAKAEVDALQADLEAAQNGQPIGQPRSAMPAPADTISTTRPPGFLKKVWLDVNVGMAMSAANASLFSFSSRLLDSTAFYAKPPRGAELDFGGGFMFTPVAGLGLNFSGAAHRDIVGLGAGFGGLVLASGVTDELVRTEGAVNLQAMFIVPVNPQRFRTRVFGGPSIIRYRANMVSDFGFARSQVTTFRAVETGGTGLGFHVGGDVTFFLSRLLGIGGFARYSRATATIDEPMSEKQQTITLGGFQTGGGLRIRF
jgi:SH3 domain-containing protein